MATVSASVLRLLRIIKRIAIAETCFGSICFIVHFAFIVKSPFEDNTSLFAFLTSNVIIIAGGLGIVAGGKISTACLINSHMGFSILVSLQCLAVITIGIKQVSDYFNFYYDNYEMGEPIELQRPVALFLFEIVSAICFGLFVASACYCYKLNTALGNSKLCGGCYEDDLQEPYFGLNAIRNKNQNKAENNGNSLALPSVIKYEKETSSSNTSNPNSDESKVTFEPLPKLHSS